MIIKGEEMSQAQAVAMDTPPPYSESLAHDHPPPTVSGPQPQLVASTSRSLPPTPVESSPSSSSPSPLPSALPSPSPAGSCRPGFKTLLPPPSDVRRTSCVRRRQENWVLKGQYVIDPYLPIPDDVRHSYFMATGAEAKNLSLSCQNGNINAEIWVVGGEGILHGADPTKARKAVLEARGQNGFVTVKVNADAQHPFDLLVVARNGGVSVAIPSSFSGPLTTATQNGWVSISSALAANVTTFSDVRGLKKCFVGDFPSSGYGRGPWQGSSLEINCTNGRIKLSYVDEMKEKEKEKEKKELKGKSSSGLLTRMFTAGSKS